jgi:hypothetical protein
VSVVKIKGRRTNSTIVVSCDGNNYYFNFVTLNCRWFKVSLVSHLTIKEYAASIYDGSPWYAC